MRATNWVKSIARVRTETWIEGRVVRAGYDAGAFAVTLREEGDAGHACEIRFTPEEADKMRRWLEDYEAERTRRAVIQAQREADAIAESAAIVNGS